MVLICFYSMMQVHTDSLGMVRSLHYSGYHDMAIFVGILHAVTIENYFRVYFILMCVLRAHGSEKVETT